MSHPLKLEAIRGFRLVTADLARATAFYRALGFEIDAPHPIAATDMASLGLSGAGRRVTMTIGAARIDLDCFDRPGRPYPMDATACDLIFQHFALVTDDADALWRQAKAAGARAISRNGLVTLPPSSGGVTAIKFRDPDGHPLEFLQFAPGTRHDWTAPDSDRRTCKGAGIIGIDHSAISVRDISASRAFYARHGLLEGTATLNHGPTQDGLDGLDAVAVDVVPMMPQVARPHVELLGYRNPMGRLSGWAPNDIAATRIVWRAAEAALLRDPDGHLHEFTP